MRLSEKLFINFENYISTNFTRLRTILKISYSKLILQIDKVNFECLDYVLNIDLF